jgi:hypothetical protein
MTRTRPMRHAARKATALRKERALHSPRFVLVHEWEDWVLMSLPLWMYRLFRVLIEHTNYRTGAGSIHMAEMLMAMTPYQPPSGPRHFVPTRDDIKRALWKFEAAGLYGRDAGRSEREGSFFFLLHPRRP